MRTLWRSVTESTACLKMNTIDIEIAIANHFDYRRNIIVSNVSWGMNIHECDLLVLTKSGYATEVEIKISKSDILRDKNKIHGHIHKKIKKLYFAVPENLRNCVDFIPERAGFFAE